MFFKLFLISIFLDLSQIQLLLPVLSKFHVQKLVILLVILGVLLDSKLVGNIKNNLSNQYKKLLYTLLIVVVLSAPFGVYPGNSLSFLIETYWKVLVGFFLVLAYTSTQDDLDKIIWSYILAIGLLATLIIKGAQEGRLAINEDVFDANDTAFLLLLALPFVWWKYVSTQGIKKIIVGAILLFVVVAIIKTNSRGAFLGLMAVLLVTIMQIRMQGEKVFGKIIIASVFVVGAVLYFGGDEYYERISTMLNPEEDYNVSSTHGRIQIWLRGLDMIITNPLLGVGVNNFIAADGMLYSDVGSRYQAAHNSFIQIGAETGLIGLIVFMLLIWRSIKWVNNVLKSIDYGLNINKAVYSSGFSIVGSWIGYVVAGFFLSAAYVTSFYFLLALSIVYVRLGTQKISSSIDKSY